MVSPSVAQRRADGGASGGVGVVRRAPFSDRPEVGARGKRTQLRILDAALTVFAEDGYHRASIDRITTRSGCSRVAFYQYFASKQDVFGHLAGQLTRQVGASIEALDPLTEDRAGWLALRARVARYGEIHARYQPIFHAYEVDDMLAAVAADTGEDVVACVHARVETTELPARQLDGVIRLLLECLNHTLDVADVLRSVAPDSYPSERVERGMTDVLHRTLFGRRAGVNVHAPDAVAPPALEFGPMMLEMLRADDAMPTLGATDRRAFTALVTAGHDVFVSRGYHNTRVEDLLTAADVSRGAFYRSFSNKDQLARVLTARALRAVSGVLSELPDVSTLDDSSANGAIRRWLRLYHAAHANEAAMLRVWLDARLQDPTLRAESAPPLDWGRRRLSEYLAGRGFGDPDVEAVVMVALLGVFGARPRSAAGVEAAACVVERGLLGR